MERDPRLLRLSREHHHALVLSLRIERELPGAGVTEMQALYADLVRFWNGGLQPHFSCEDECMLARLASRADPGLRLAGRLQRDHRELEGLVDAMASARMPDDRRDAMGRFGIQLRDHIRWEERELFEWLQSQLGEEDLDAIGAYIEEHLPAEPLACPMPHDP
ncbi:MAG: hemerythrin domain-containing protein [Dehalococcoidia bacterium]|nr:hemerythrin domain-containing protein [Dehalococcoidia bacterium]